MAVEAPSSGAALGVSLRDVAVRFPSEVGPVEAVSPISLTIEPGTITALLGPSGCGKSTLLRAIAGLQPHGGTVELLAGHGQSAADLRQSVAFVFQDPTLLPWRNVLRNVMLPLELRDVGKPERRGLAADALERVGLAPDTHRRYPVQLSGGMRMRASLARALVTRPKLLLLDEPFAALDELSRETLDLLLRDLQREAGTTMLFVTHSVAEAVFLADRALVFSPRPASVRLDHTIDLPASRPLSLRTDPAFIRHQALLSQALRSSAGVMR